MDATRLGPEELERLRAAMVTQQLEARGVRSTLVLDAMGRVQREGYVPSYLGEFAYEDAPLPIEEEQTISQPLIVALMIEALQLEGGERVLEVGTGSGYAAAVLAQIAGEVFTIERHASLARSARERLQRDGYRNVHVRHGDGTLGWPEAAPFDAIVVAAGGPSVPQALRDQLRVGGRLVIPVGDDVGSQALVRVTRVDRDRYHDQDLGPVRFVPLIGAQGWGGGRSPAPAPRATPADAPPHASRAGLVDLLRECAEPFDRFERAALGPLLERIGDARVVLIGEATHGTAEFYGARAAITRALVEHSGFRIVAAEADWPDAASIDHYARDRDLPARDWRAFARFPVWMWRNRETADFVEWLRAHNLAREPGRRTRFAGLDIYGLENSIEVVLRYLDEHDPQTGHAARERYGCLTPWQREPAAYGRAALTGAYQSCEPEVLQMLEHLLDERLEAIRLDDEGFYDLIRNAVGIVEGEAYYRTMYYAAHESWNLRDRHMFDTLESLLDFHGPESKAVVWAHNSHVGDARATAMAGRGELNLGELARRRFGDGAYLIGFGTDRGTVRAASHWDGPDRAIEVPPARAESYERLCHATGLEGFLLPLRRPARAELCERLERPRLERAIGVIYRPETELASHYFEAVLPRQFDEYIWIDETHAVEPLATKRLEGADETYPFGL